MPPPTYTRAKKAQERSTSPVTLLCSYLLTAAFFVIAILFLAFPNTSRYAAAICDVMYLSLSMCRYLIGGVGRIRPNFSYISLLLLLSTLPLLIHNIGIYCSRAYQKHHKMLHPRCWKVILFGLLGHVSCPWPCLAWG